ncbi:MAG TPA: hypothetical protein VLB84_06180, partial [Bacteroidia bacterium]|nr:hypothetical protein [Bacteroidia bacterium]
MTKKTTRLGNSLSYAAWHRLKKNKLAMLGFWIICICLMVAILGYTITPDASPDANNQLLEISKKPPGFRVMMLQVRKNEPAHQRNFLSKMLFGKQSDFRSVPFSEYTIHNDSIVCREYNTASKKQTEIRFSLADVVYAVNTDSSLHTDLQQGTIEFCELESNRKITESISELKNRVETKHIIEKKYILGTDPSGRDLLSRLLLGTRVSFSVGFISVFISVFIGMFIGAIAGYYRGKVDAAIVWLPNPDGALMTQMTAQVFFVVGEARDALLVPFGAVQRAPDGRASVRVVHPDGRLEHRAVEVGLTNRIQAEIRSGLQP